MSCAKEVTAEGDSRDGSEWNSGMLPGPQNGLGLWFSNWRFTRDESTRIVLPLSHFSIDSPSSYLINHQILHRPYTVFSRR